MINKPWMLKGQSGLPLTGWSYRKPVTLSRASGAVTNYQMKVLVGESSGATGEDVDCGGKCLSSFNDLRFTAADGTTLLDYWIESTSGATPNQLATIWIEFNSIGTDATTFYMYYGKADAAAVSSGANTFIKFDDFERGSPGDEIGGDWTVTNDHVHISGEYDRGDISGYFGTRSVKLPTNISTPAPDATIPVTADSGIYAIRCHFYKVDVGVIVPIAHGNGTKRALVRMTAAEDIEYYNGSWTDSGANCSADTWQVLEVNNFDFSAGTFDICINDSVVKSGAAMHTNSGQTNVNRIQGYISNPVNNGGYLDLFCVRNWRSTGPAWGAWGAEEAA